MARARNIKPGFFMNEILAEVDPLGRILFAGLWTIADREGRLEDRPKKIKAEILPYDNCNIEKLLQSLSDKNFIIRYEANGQKYIAIVNFSKHQNPHIKEPASSIPAPDLHHTSTVQEPDENGSSPADSLNLIPDSLKPIKDIIPYAEIVDHLNATCGTNYKPDTKATKELINGRWGDGFRLDDFKQVINNKARDWLNDPEFVNYLRPSTLFAPKKFEGYLNQKGGQAHEPTKKRNDHNDWDEDKFYTTAPET